MDDIKESIEELKYYQQFMFAKKWFVVGKSYVKRNL